MKPIIQELFKQFNIPLFFDDYFSRLLYLFDGFNDSSSIQIIENQHINLSDVYGRRRIEMKTLFCRKGLDSPVLLLEANYDKYKNTLFVKNLYVKTD